MSDHDPKKCETCQRIGLPVLLTRVSAHDNAQHPNLIDKIPANIDAGWPQHQLATARPVLRQLRGGWLYIFVEKFKGDPKKCWRFFEVSTDGFIFPTQRAGFGDALFNAPAEFMCSRAAQNFKPRFLVVRDAAHIGKVWLAYSEHAWSKRTLDAYAATQALREERMQPLDASAWIKGGAMPTNAQRLTAAVLQAQVAEYKPASDKDALIHAFAYSDYRFDSSKLGQAPALQQAATEVEATEPQLAGKTLLFTLHDPLGLGSELNGLRLRTAKLKFDWMGGDVNIDGNKDAKRPWKAQSAVMIDQVEAIMRACKADREAANLRSGVYMSSIDYAARDLFGNIPKGTRVEQLPQSPFAGGMAGTPPPAMFKVYYPESEIKKRADSEGASKTDRMRERYDRAALETFRKTHAAEEAAWDKRIKALDSDWAQWLAACAGRITKLLEHDIDVHKLADVSHLLRYTGNLIAGTALSEDSRIWYGKHFNLPATDPLNWSARALALASSNLLEQFERSLTQTDSAGLGSKLYDIAKGTYEALEGIPEARNELKEALAKAPAIEQTAIYADALLSTGSSVLSQMQTAALAQQAYGGITYTTQTVARLQARWVRMAFVQAYVRSGERMSTAIIRMQVHEYLNWQAEFTQLATIERVSMQTTSGGTTQVESNALQVKQAKGMMRVRPVPGGQMIDAVVILSEDMAAELKITTTNTIGYTVHAGGPMSGAVATAARVGEAQVEKVMQAGILRSRAAMKNFLVADKGWMPGLVMAFQAWAFFDAAGKIGAARGWERLDAIAAMSSAVAGFSAGSSEVIALAIQQRVGAEALSVLRWKLAVGMLASLGATIDSVGAYMKARSKSAEGNTAASNAYFGGAAGFFTSAALTASGSYLAYVARGGGGALARAAMQRVGTAVAVRAGTAVAGEAAGAGAAAAGAGLAASWITGIGLVITIVAVGVMIYGAMMEDDDAEKYLRRTPFGKHGDDNKPCGSLEEEINAFYEFQYGVRVELKWNGEWLGFIGSDKIELKIEIGSFDEAKSKIDYQLKYLPKPNSQGAQARGQVMASGTFPGTISAPIEGGMKNLNAKGDIKMLELTTDVVIDDRTYDHAVLDYKYWPDGPTGVPIAGSISVSDG